MADVTRFVDRYDNGGIWIEGTLATARPVGSLVRNTADGELYASTDAATPTYTKITNTTGGPTFTGIELLEAGGAITNYGTIAAAMTAAVSGDVVLLYPNTYNEDIDFTGKGGVRVTGYPNAENVIIAGSSTTSTRVLLNEASTLREVTVMGPSSGANPAIDATGLSALEIGVLQDVELIAAGGTGPLIAGAGLGQLAVLTAYHNGGTTSACFIDISGGACTVTNIIPNAGSCAAVFKVANATLEGHSVVWGPFWSGTTIFELGANAEVGFVGIGEKAGTPAVTQGVHITAGPVTLQLEAASIRSTANDFVVDAGVDGTGSNMRWTSVNARQETFDSPAIWNSNVTVVLNYLDDGIQNDPVVRVGGGFSVGATSNTATSDFGAGAPVVNTMMVFSDDGTGTAFIDNTTAAAARVATPFNIMQSGALGDLCYVGAGFPFTDIPFELATAITAGTITASVSDGVGGWLAVPMMEHDGIAPYEQRADVIFRSTGNNYLLINNGVAWATAAVNGTTKYWLKLEVTSALSGIPVGDRFRVGRSRATFTGDGHPLLFGEAAPIRTFWEGGGESLSDPSGGANAPNTENISISTNVSYQQEKSRFNNGVNERAGTQIEVPFEIDTSQPVDFSMIWYSKGTSTTAVRWQVYAVEVRTGDVIGALTEQSVIVDIAPPGVIGQTTKTTFSFDLPDIIPGDEIAFMLWRQGTTDSNGDDMVVMSMQWSARFWS